MEKKKLVLSLNKEIVANLNKSEMSRVDGGQVSLVFTKCNTLCVYSCYDTDCFCDSVNTGTCC